MFVDLSLEQYRFQQLLQILQLIFVIVFEGATDDDNETTLGVVDPTMADRTINLPNASGTVFLQLDTDNTFITGKTTITSGDVTPSSDELLLSDADAGVLKRVTVDNLISSGWTDCCISRYVPSTWW